MSVTKKSLISNREVAKKAVIASNASEPQQTSDLKASALTAQSMKKKSASGHSFAALKKTSRQITFKSPKII